jgi:hypothetical protein
MVEEGFEAVGFENVPLRAENPEPWQFTANKRRIGDKMKGKGEIL